MTAPTIMTIQEIITLTDLTMIRSYLLANKHIIAL